MIDLIENIEERYADISKQFPKTVSFIYKLKGAINTDRKSVV